MQVATGTLSPLLRKLDELLAAEFTLSSRVKKGIQSLTTALEMMYVRRQVRVWAAKVRELSYNMEDAVDAYMVRVYDGSHGDLGPNNLKNRVNKFFKRTKKLFSKGKAPHHISGAIQDAQELAKELGELGGVERQRGETGGAPSGPQPSSSAGRGEAPPLFSPYPPPLVFSPSSLLFTERRHQTATDGQGTTREGELR
ncbi:hypothetical protein ZWY2020_055414 [Hordeum vulgare]|nr:hypothetical protein ZWY2020_055414 [Hordeum vulgare]